MRFVNARVPPNAVDRGVGKKRELFADYLALVPPTAGMNDGAIAPLRERPLG